MNSQSEFSGAHPISILSPSIALPFLNRVERWAANTLRTLGIILTAGFILVVSLLLALLSICAAGPTFGGSSGNKEEAAMYALAAIVVLFAGIAFITWLARGILSANRQPLPADELEPTAPHVDRPLHLSPLSRKAIDRLVAAIGAQILVSSAVWIYSQITFWTRPRIFAPFPRGWIYLLIPFVLYHVPYAILIYWLLKRPDRRAFSYSLAVPAVLVMQSLLSLSVISYYLQHQPLGLLLMFIPWAIHVVILVFAYQAIQQVGLHPKPSGLIVAAAVSLVFFAFVHTLTPILYRFIRL